MSPPVSEAQTQAQTPTLFRLEEAQDSDRSSLDTFPEGGRKAWVNVLGR